MMYQGQSLVGSRTMYSSLKKETRPNGAQTIRNMHAATQQHQLGPKPTVRRVWAVWSIPHRAFPVHRLLNITKAFLLHSWSFLRSTIGVVNGRRCRILRQLLVTCLRTLQRPLVFLYNGQNHKRHSFNSYVLSPLQWGS